jgi:hypothetical protein
MCLPTYQKFSDLPSDADVNDVVVDVRLVMDKSAIEKSKRLILGQTANDSLMMNDGHVACL